MKNQTLGECRGKIDSSDLIRKLGKGYENRTQKSFKEILGEYFPAHSKVIVDSTRMQILSILCGNRAANENSKDDVLHILSGEITFALLRALGFAHEAQDWD